jgi:hypothetical protein
MAREATNFWYLRLHLLRRVCGKTSVIRSSLLMPPSVPVHLRSAPPRYQSNGKTHRTEFCVARHSERLLHRGTGLSGLPALRLSAAGSPFSSRSHGSHGTPSNVSRLYILLHCSLPFHTLARGLQQHRQHCGMRPRDRLDIPFWLPADHNHRSGTPV